MDWTIRKECIVVLNTCTKCMLSIQKLEKYNACLYSKYQCFRNKTYLNHYRFGDTN